MRYIFVVGVFLVACGDCQDGEVTLNTCVPSQRLVQPPADFCQPGTPERGVFHTLIVSGCTLTPDERGQLCGSEPIQRQPE
jgi:hypothetical protein